MPVERKRGRRGPSALSRRGSEAGRTIKGVYRNDVWHCRIYRTETSPGHPCGRRSEEHTSELQSRENLVCRLLLEKNKRILFILHLSLDKLVQESQQWLTFWCVLPFLHS